MAERFLNAVREAEVEPAGRQRGLGQSRLVLVGLAIALAFAVQALVPDRLSPHDPLKVQVERGLRPICVNLKTIFSGAPPDRQVADGDGVANRADRVLPAP